MDWTDTVSPSFLKIRQTSAGEHKSVPCGHNLRGCKGYFRSSDYNCSKKLNDHMILKGSIFLFFQFSFYTHQLSTSLAHHGGHVLEPIFLFQLIKFFFLVQLRPWSCTFWKFRRWLLIRYDHLIIVMVENDISWRTFNCIFLFIIYILFYFITSILGLL